MREDEMWQACDWRKIRTTCCRKTKERGFLSKYMRVYIERDLKKTRWKMVCWNLLVQFKRQCPAIANATKNF